MTDAVTDKPADPAVKAADAAIAVKKKREVILVEPRMASAEQWRQDWVVNAEEGTTIDDVLDPMYWAHVAAKFSPYDHVEVRLETGQWILDLIVVGVGRNWARVHVAAKHDLHETSSDAPRAAIKHRVDYKGPQKKHCVIRIGDSALLQDGFATKALAEEWLSNHERVTA